MWPNPQFLADLVTFTEEILNGKLHFFVQFLSNAFLVIKFWIIFWSGYARVTGSVGRIEYCCKILTRFGFHIVFKSKFTRWWVSSFCILLFKIIFFLFLFSAWYWILVSDHSVFPSPLSRFVGLSYLNLACNKKGHKVS